MDREAPKWRTATEYRHFFHPRIQQNEEIRAQGTLQMSLREANDVVRLSEAVLFQEDKRNLQSQPGISDVISVDAFGRAGSSTTQPEGQ